MSPLITFIFLSVAQFSTWNLQVGAAKLPPAPALFNQSTTCGQQVLDAPTGSISYKPSESLAPNERCVWIIRVTSATDYTVELTELGFPGPSEDHKLSITGVNQKQNNSHISPSSLGSYNIPGRNLLIVTFHSGPNPNNSTSTTGFTLNYEATVSSIGGISDSSTDTFLSAAEGFYELPTVGWWYDNNEISLVILTSADNLFHPEQETEVTIGTVFLETACFDNVELYLYNTSASTEESPSWTWAQEFCQSETTETWSFGDIQLLIFRSDDDFYNVGFWLEYRKFVNKI